MITPPMASMDTESGCFPIRPGCPVQAGRLPGSAHHRGQGSANPHGGHEDKGVNGIADAKGSHCKFAKAEDKGAPEDHETDTFN